MTKIPTVGFISLGCPKNLVDSEKILSELRTQGYRLVSNYDDADILIVNTCGFIDSAVQESLEAIGEALAENGKVIVTGCLGTKENLIRELHPKVLEISGPHSYEQVVLHVNKYLPKPVYSPYTSLSPDLGVKLTPKHYAYLKISEGCNHTCTFCIIPSLRGKLESRAVNHLLDEAKQLVAAGVKELLVISQDTSAYGVDTKNKLTFWQGKPIKTNLVSLCEELSQFDIWIRLHYVYPYPDIDKIIPLMQEGKILPYLDIPLQHASPKILKLMKRPGSIDRMLERIRQWRKICPNITLRSTFIVGFPGETETDFELLLDFLKQARLDRVGCFKYSPIEGATANMLPEPVPEELKQLRYERFMQLQQQISLEKLTNRIGQVEQVIIDAIETERLVARSKSDAPEIDGVVYIKRTAKSHNLAVGEIVTVRIDDANEYDLYATYLGS